jgi:formylglycine-generating enzyme required for sulfatase activity
MSAIQTRKQAMPTPAPKKGMVWIPGGSFTMGSDNHYPEEAPAYRVTVDGFWMDAHQVTNADFRKFVKATGFVTLAEQAPRAEDYPGADPEMLQPGSVVFTQPRVRVRLDDHYQWWQWKAGANWKHPEGSKSNIKGREQHPVVHLAWEDVQAYAAWAGKELPTEAEWEFACRGGRDGAAFAWGDELAPNGRMLANYWQGEFPWKNLATDGFERTAPVGSFPANRYDLYDMIGNVWEWTADWYADRHVASHSCCGSVALKPAGADRAASVDPTASGRPTPRKVMKGGSFACAANYCQRYRPAARMGHPVDTGTNHIGFRCIVRRHEADGRV